MPPPTAQYTITELYQNTILHLTPERVATATIIATAFLPNVGSIRRFWPGYITGRGLIGFGIWLGGYYTLCANKSERRHILLQNAREGTHATLEDRLRLLRWHVGGFGMVCLGGFVLVRELLG